MMSQKVLSKVEMGLIGCWSDYEPDVVVGKEMSASVLEYELLNLAVQLLVALAVVLAGKGLGDVLISDALPSVSSIWFDDFGTKF